MNATATAAALPAGTWTVDPVASFVGFRVANMGSGIFRSSFEEVTASYDGDAKALRGEVQVESIQLRLPPLRGHLLSPDFFDVERHKTISFESRAIRLGDNGRLEIDGDLTINGISKPVTATGVMTEPSMDMNGGQRFAVDLSTTVDRRDYGVSWNAELPNGELAVGWDVTLEATLAFTGGSEQ
jgi:polyisoprenoid-binding protein YceI